MRLLRKASVAAALVASPIHAQVASDKPPPVRLEYIRSAGATRCPDEVALRAAVAARIGYEPFDGSAERRVRVEVQGAAGGYRASLRMLAPDGSVVGEREMTSSRLDCSDLGEALAFALSVVVDPLGLARAPVPLPPAQPPSPPPASPPVADPPQPPPALTQAPEPSPEPWSFHASAGPTLSLGAAPRPVLGLAVQGAARRRWLSVALEGRADLASEVAAGGGQVRTALVLGVLAACAHADAVAGCATVGAGALRAEGIGLERARRISAPYFLLGARLQYCRALLDRFSVRAHIDAWSPQVRTVLGVGKEDVWSTPPLAGAAGVSAVVHFP